MSDAPSQDTWELIFADICSVIEYIPKPPARSTNKMSVTDLNMIKVVPVAWGWLMRVMRTSEAILKLEEDGFSVEAAPLRRSVLEHSIRLHWASNTDRDVWIELLNKDHGRTFQRFREASADGLALNDEQMDWVGRQEALASTRFQEKSNLSSINHVFQSDPGLYAVQKQGWLLHTLESHPSINSADAYSIASDDLSEIQLFHDPKSGTTRRAHDELSVHLYIAIASYGVLVDIEKQLDEQLSGLGERMQLMLRAESE